MYIIRPEINWLRCSQNRHEREKKEWVVSYDVLYVNTYADGSRFMFHETLILSNVIDGPFEFMKRNVLEGWTVR